MTDQDSDYWYDHRNELEQEQVFRMRDGSYVKLDHRKCGDGTQWVVASWHEGFPGTDRYVACAPHWSYEEDTIEPGDLRERLPDDWKG